MKIAILTPTRQRPGRFERFIESVYTTCSKPDNIICLNYVDNDDPRIVAYKEVEQRWQPVGHNTPNFIVENVYGDPISVSKSWNIIAEMAVTKYDVDLLIMGNDDQVYMTPGWDRILEEEIEAFGKPVFCMWFQDGINGENHCAFPILPRLWYDTLGQFAPGVFHFGYNDTWNFDIAKRAGITHYIDRVFVEHQHFTTGKSVMDATYHRNRTQERGNLYSLDKVIFEDTSPQRQEAAEKLKTLL